MSDKLNRIMDELNDMANFKGFGESKEIRMNNFEKIKSMNIDEMVRWLWRITNCECCEASKKDCCFGAGKCEKTLKQWLQAESEEE